MVTEDTGKALADFDKMEARVISHLAPLVAELQAMLDGLAGRSFGSLEANQAVTRQLVVLLNRLGMRVECPGCGQPAILRCSPMARRKDGAFRFEHRLPGRTTYHMAAAALPRLKLVPYPPDLRRTDAHEAVGRIIEQKTP
jgi:predicted RNA-binding Zn-ribbon protein involved in translation (DUF1610 family)